MLTLTRALKRLTSRLLEQPQQRPDPESFSPREWADLPVYHPLVDPVCPGRAVLRP